MKKEKIVAYRHINNFGGIAILDIKYGLDDKVKSAFYYGSELTGKAWNKVHYNPSGGDYFIKGGVMYFLDDFIVSNE